MKYETLKMASKPKSPKKLEKSKVKQLASMFESKILQIIQGENKVGNYDILSNEFSPAAKSQTTAKPAAIPRTCYTKPTTLVSSPRSKPLAKQEALTFNYLVTEDVFNNMSVKDKAQLYNQFVKNMSKNYNQLDKHAGLKKVDNKKPVRAEVIAKKQATVKDLQEELEFNTVFPKTTNKAIQRLDTMNIALDARKNSKAIKAKEFEDILDNKQPIIQKTKSLPCLHNTTVPVQKQTTNTIFQNYHLEDLFCTWFKQKHANKSDVEDITNQSEVDKLLDEALAQMEIIEAETNKPITSKTNDCNSNSLSSTTAIAKISALEESESGLSSLPKNTSEESQTESQRTKTHNLENDFNFVKTLKPLRKRKLRRNPICKKDYTQKEANQQASTDTETDSKQTETQLHNKTLFMQTKPQPEETATHQTQLEPEDQSFVVLDESLMRVVNSPSKIKSAYTLTVLETPLCTPRSSYRFPKPPQLHKSTNNIAQLTDSSTDQGFETAATNNNADIPLKVCNIPDPAEIAYSPFSSSLNSNKSNFSFSTPIKGQEHNFTFTATGGSAKQQRFSLNSPKTRRKSFSDADSRRSSITMQAISEDQALEPQETHHNNLYSKTEQKFFGNTTATEINKETTNLPSERSSHFWIVCGDFSLALEIDYNDADNLRLLYESFSQTSRVTKDLHFGIDDQIFSIHGRLNIDSILKVIPANKGCSQYWFSTGDLAIPFSGKYLTSYKIQRLFRVMRETVEETGILRFGVDAFEFSNVPKFWCQPAKLSVESQCSMLVGLQSGDSNGLEGHSKYAWPNTKPVMISDLDQFDNEAYHFEEIESDRLPVLAFSNNHYNLASLGNEELSMPRNSQAMMSLESYCEEYESEPLVQLLEDSCSQEWKQAQNRTLPEVNNTVLSEQQQRLSEVQGHLTNCVKPCYIAKDSLDGLKGTAEYVEKLKSVVSNISYIGGSNNFKACTLEELESYMHFLSRYAEIYLSCNKDMGTVLKA